MSGKKDSQVRHSLDPAHTDPVRLKKERAKARELRKTPWWKEKIRSGACHYCGKLFSPKELTMDHILPLARGGTSVKSNLVPACTACNREKRLDSPLDALFAAIAAEHQDR